MPSHVGRIRAIEVHETFAATEHGQKLAGSLRWDRYKPQDVSPERWRKLLGVDANNLGHMPLTANLTRVLVSRIQETMPGHLSEEDAVVLELGAVSHDWGEAVVSDISYSDKTEADEALERSAFEQNLTAFYPEDSEEIMRLLKIAHGSVIFNPETRLGEVFNIVERIGYMRTGLRAAGHVQAGRIPDCDESFRWIVADVLGNQIPSLVEFAEKYPPVREYLVTMALDISRGFNVVHPGTFENYDESKKQLKSDMFSRAHTLFHEWWMSTPEFRHGVAV